MKTYLEHLGRSAPDYGLVKKQVDKILLENSIISAPVPIKELAENYLSKIYFAEFPKDVSNVMGFYDPEDNTIVVNESDSPNRQTFTIAHELGHAILHRQYVRDYPDEYKVLLRAPMGSQKDPIEQEANSFAANLLVPKKILDLYYRIASVSELSKLFNVSAEVVRWRLQNEYNLLVS